MKRIASLCIAAIISVSFNLALAEELKPVRLPSPRMNAGKPLMQALKERKSSRDFSNKPLSAQVLSDLLWAAWGINRPKTKGRTAPSAMNMQEIDIYVAMPSGLYLYDAVMHSLLPVSIEDIRALTGKQDFVSVAALNLIYVADLARAKRAEPNTGFYTVCDTGFISQNVYLYCASEGLATVVRGLFDKPPLARAMKLRPDQKIVLAQTVGYPK